MECFRSQKRMKKTTEDNLKKKLSNMSVVPLNLCKSGSSIVDNTLDCHSRGSKIDPSSVFRMVERTFCHAVLRNFSCLNLYMEKNNSGWFKQLLTKFKFRKKSRNLCISFSVVAFLSSHAISRQTVRSS